MLATAGLLLTGGASRRLGVDKPDLRRGDERLAERGARLLTAVCTPVLEVGPGTAGLPTVREQPPGGGPLAAVAAGGAALAARAAPRHTVVLAVDLPFVEAPLLRWLADHPAPGAVVPRVDGVPQPLCARYSADDLAAAARLLAAGHAAMRDLLAAVPVTYADEADWGPHADPDAFTDVDTPDAAARAGLRWPDPR